LGAAPAERTFGGAVEEDIHQGLFASAAEAHGFRIDAHEQAGVLFGPNVDRAVDGFLLEFGDGVDVGELFLAGVLEEDFLSLSDVDARKGVAASGHDLAEDFADERSGGRAGGDPDKLAAFDADGVVDQDIGEFFDAGIGHGGIVRWGCRGATAGQRPEVSGRAVAGENGTGITCD
jgi:hypothetical protein